MESVFENAWRAAVQAEKELLKALSEKEPTFKDMNDFLARYREACQNDIFLDFDPARSVDVEGRLWDATVKINARFRKQLAGFRDSSGKKRPVEKRKLEKRYLDFIKTSQRYYRGYIQRLASHFGSMPELEKVARKFSFDNPTSDSQIETTPAVRKRILASCHSTLIRLGDLSRYRETELVHKDRNWGPAIGYYDLASNINPSSGTSHNQLAIIALADNNHLRATYHLYRALSALEPHPTSRKNLEIEFKKILNKKNIIPSEDAGIPGRALIPWFVYLHAECYKGDDFAEHDELENEVMSQLTVGLKERSLEATLQKFVLINMAAEDCAKLRSKDEPAYNAHLFFQRINVKTFFTLLQILLPELERFTATDCEKSDGTKSTQDTVTVVARRVLPAIRQYSSWLLSNSHALIIETEDRDTPLHIQIREFWKLYASTLSLLASTFDIVNLPEVNYLLEEDKETLGFRPLMNGETSRRYFYKNGQFKPQLQDESAERHHPNDEMLFRIRDFFVDGLDLVVRNRIPIALVDDNGRKLFVYQEEDLPSQLFSSPNGHHHSLSSTSVERDDIQQAQETRNYVGHTGPAAEDAASQSASASVSANTSMNRMVDALVDSEPSESAPAVSTFPVIQDGYPLTPTGHSYEREPNSISNYVDGAPNVETTNYSTIRASQTPTATQFPMAQPYSPRPNLPSIFNTAFAPQPGEATSPQSRPGTARQASPPGSSPHPHPSLTDINNFGTPQGPMSSYAAFQHNLNVHKQELQSSPQDFCSSWDTPVRLSQQQLGASNIGDHHHLRRLPHLQQYPLNRASLENRNNNGNTFSSNQFSHPDSSMGNSSGSMGTNLGPVGQTPPSGQGGG